jgi:hypothetical protein
MNRIWFFCIVCFISFPFCNVERRVAAEVARVQLQNKPVVYVLRDTVIYRDTVAVRLDSLEQTNEILGGWFALPDVQDTVLQGEHVRLEIRRDTVIRIRTVVKERGIAVPVIDTIYLTRQVQVPASETHADRWAWLYALAAGLAGLVLFLTQNRRKNGN